MSDIENSEMRKLLVLRKLGRFAKLGVASDRGGEGRKASNEMSDTGGAGGRDSREISSTVKITIIKLVAFRKFCKFLGQTTAERSRFNSS